MQTLDFDLKEALEHREYEIPQGATGLNFRVSDGEKSVALTVDGKTISLTVAGARDLALALRQSANRVEGQIFGRMGKSAQKYTGHRR
jgi:hypothetical protein